MSDGQADGGAGAGGNDGGAAAGASGGEGGASSSEFLGGAGDGGSGGGSGGEGGGGDGGAGGDVGGGADPEWYGQLSAEIGEGESASTRDWVKAKGFKDLDGLVKAHRAAEKAIHDSGRVKVPGEDAKPEEVAAFRKAIGVPDDAKGYAMPVLNDGDGNPVEMDTGRLEAIAAIAHKHGIPKGALEATLQELAEQDFQTAAGSELELSKKADAFVKTWGAEKDTKLEDVDRGIALLGLQRGEPLKLRAALGPERALELMQALGSKASEDSLVGGGGRQTFLGDPIAAQKEMDGMKADKAIRDKVYIPGTPENVRWNRLEAIVIAGEQRKQRENA